MLNVTNLKRLAVAGVVASTLALVGCLQGEDQKATSNGTAVLGIHTSVEGVNHLSKGSLISLNKLILVITSDGTPKDTIRDTSVAGQNGFVATSTTPQSVVRNFTVKPLRHWKVVATVKDTKDSVIHRDSTALSSNFLLAADTLAISLNLSAKYQMYQANFVTLPDSVSSSTGATGAKQVLQIKRLVLKIDNVIVADSTSPTFFTKLATASITYDYVVPGSHSVRLMAFGPMGSTYTNPLTDSLFAATSTINVLAGADSTIASFPLSWVGPNTGVDQITVNIGKVGKVTVNGTSTGVNQIP